MRTLVSVVAVTMVASSSFAATKGGVTMPDQVTVEGQQLVLNGMGIREATVFKVDVYVAGLYLPVKTQDAKAIISSDSPKQIVMKFVREVERAKLVDAWTAGFGKAAAIADRVKQFNDFMVDVKPGDSFTITYVPSKGTEVKVNNATKGTIPGADFASALLNIWLGPNPPNPGLRSGMLGS